MPWPAQTVQESDLSPHSSPARRRLEAPSHPRQPACPATDVSARACRHGSRHERAEPWLARGVYTLKPCKSGRRGRSRGDGPKGVGGGGEQPPPMAAARSLAQGLAGSARCDSGRAPAHLPEGCAKWAADTTCSAAKTFESTARHLRPPPTPWMHEKGAVWCCGNEVMRSGQS